MRTRVGLQVQDTTSVPELLRMVRRSPSVQQSFTPESTEPAFIYHSFTNHSPLEPQSGLCAFRCKRLNERLADALRLMKQGAVPLEPIPFNFS